MKDLKQQLHESLNINEAHDSFFLTTKISQYLCEVQKITEVKEILENITKGLIMALNKREKQLSSEKEANLYLKNVIDGWDDVLEDEFDF